MLTCRIWSFCAKWCRHKYGKTPKIGES